LPVKAALNLSNAFAGKPAPTSRLAGEGGLEPFIDLLDAFAGKPAPTGEVSVSSTAKSS
jgi:hypothetical protein